MGFLSSLFGGGSSRPATTTNVVSSKLPPEIAPYVEQILKEGSAQFETEKAAGYQPYTGETTAQLTAQQEAALTGLEGLAGTQKPFLDEAGQIVRQGAEQFTGDTAQQYMSPYQQAVTDIELREAQRRFEGDTLPRLEAQAVGMGGMSGLGSRAGVEMAEAQRSQNQLLADIQAKGQQRAFDAARQEFGLQKAREREMASDITGLGRQEVTAGLAELGALKSAGEERQALAQSALDEAYLKYQQEQQFPKQNLAEFSQLVYGNPLVNQATRSTTTTATPYQPSTGQQLLGMGLGAANIYGMGGGFGKSGFSLGQLGQSFGFPKKEGGVVGRAEGGGLSDLPVIQRQTSGGLGFNLPTSMATGPSSTEFQTMRKSLIEKMKKEPDLEKKKELNNQLRMLVQTAKGPRMQEEARATDTAMRGVEKQGLKDLRTINREAIKAQEDLSTDLSEADKRLLDNYSIQKGIDINTMAKAQQKELADHISGRTSKLGKYTGDRTKLTKETLEALKGTQKNIPATGFMNLATGVMGDQGIIKGGLEGLKEDFTLGRKAALAKAQTERDIISKGQAMKDKDLSLAYGEEKEIDTTKFTKGSEIEKKRYNDLSQLTDKEYEAKHNMSKEEGRRKSNILTMKNTAATQELAKDEKNKLNRIIRSSEFQEKVGLLNEQEANLISNLIKEKADLGKIIGEIEKLRAEAQSKGAGQMKSGEMRVLLDKNKLANSFSYDPQTGTISVRGNAGLTPKKSLIALASLKNVLDKMPTKAGMYKVSTDTQLENLVKNFQGMDKVGQSIKEGKQNIAMGSGEEGGFLGSPLGVQQIEKAKEYMKKHLKFPDNVIKIIVEEIEW